MTAETSKRRRKTKQLRSFLKTSGLVYIGLLTKCTAGVPYRPSLSSFSKTVDGHYPLSKNKEEESEEEKEGKGGKGRKGEGTVLYATQQELFVNATTAVKGRCALHTVRHESFKEKEKKETTPSLTVKKRCVQ